MPLPTEKLLAKPCGYGAALLRECLDRAVPEAQGSQKAYAQELERAGAEYPSESTMSRWLSGERRADLKSMEKLFDRCPGTQDRAGDIVSAVNYLYTHQNALRVGEPCPEPPPLAKQFLDRTIGPGTEVVEATLTDNDQARAYARPGASTSIENIEATDSAEIGDVETGAGSATTIKDIKTGRLKIGNVRSGVDPAGS